MTLITTTISAMTAVLDANLDDTAVFPLDDKNRNTRHATLVQVRAQLLKDVIPDIDALTGDVTTINNNLTTINEQITTIESGLTPLVQSGIINPMSARNDLIKGGRFGTPTRHAAADTDTVLSLIALDPFFSGVGDGFTVGFGFTPVVDSTTDVVVKVHNIKTSAYTLSAVTPAAWDGGHAYLVGDRVARGAGFTVFQCTAPNTGNTPETSPGYWTIPVAPWDSTIAYKPGDEVTKAWITYVCTVANTNHSPPDTSRWKLTAYNWIVFGSAPGGSLIWSIALMGIVWNAPTSSGLINPMTTIGDMIMGDTPVSGVAPLIRLPADIAGKFLVMWGTPPTPTWLYLNLAGLGYNPGSVPPVRVPFVYTTAGATTHTVSAGCYRVEYELWGGGGSFFVPGAYNCPTGGGGAYAWGSTAVTPGDTIAIVVGAAGGYGTASTDSSINTTDLVAGGGGGGLGGILSADTGLYAGAGGVASGTLSSKLLVPGGSGGYSNSVPETMVSSGVYAFPVEGQIFIGGASPHGGNGAQQHQISIGSATFNSWLPAMSPGGGGVYTGILLSYPTDGQVIVWEYQ
jgi:hypothetical protein